jgi:two-component system chemotaxis response regulator CheY
MNTILLVDDSRVTREVLKVFLIGKNLTVLEAVDGLAAMRVIHEQHPDLVIADLRMPKLDGYGLLEAVRADARIRATPVLILTGTTDAQTAERCRAAGALEVLSKPIQPRPLLEAVARHLPFSSTAPSHHP